MEEPKNDGYETMVKVRKQRSTSTSAIIIDYDKFTELYHIDFRRAYVPEDKEPPVTPVTTETKETNPQTNHELPFPPASNDIDHFLERMYDSILLLRIVHFF